MALGKNLKASQIDTHSENDDLIQDNVEFDQNIQEEGQDGEELKTRFFCVFGAGGVEYAIPMHYVKEVVKMPSSTPIPQMPPYFSSMVNIRGEVYGILDLSLFFRNVQQDNSYKYLLVLKDEDYRVTIALNFVPNTLKVNEKMIEELSSSTFGIMNGKKYLTGIIKKGKQMIILFDVKGMISSESFTEISIND
jgi:purine-binding chemotaxis protein CheW